MPSIEDLFNMVAAEAAQSQAIANNERPYHKVEDKLPPIDYRLQVIRQPDGTYKMIEE